MSLTVPTQQRPFYSLVTRLDGADYKLEFRYSPRADRFYLNLYDTNEVLLLAGIKLVPGVALLHYYHHLAGVPAGELVVTTSGPDGSAPGLNELGPGLRCVLSYFTAAEVAAGKAAAGL